MFFRIVYIYLQVYTVLQPRKPTFTVPILLDYHLAIRMHHCVVLEKPPDASSKRANYIVGCLETTFRSLSQKRVPNYCD
jgi:hypothetical protein